ncbi:putative phosphoenolpyruvate synthase [Caerostris extrusa]|uniref:Phosphoenolpyruvate synthase n=1 Tax=Caerostris extrusa TaxID=172846 RepID=A0AAV4NFF3_CAEEX|nr:putative phosphoenolpyruvate synthase [Caerostris extrusa]
MEKMNSVNLRVPLSAIILHQFWFRHDRFICSNTFQCTIRVHLLNKMVHSKDCDTNLQCMSSKQIRSLRHQCCRREISENGQESGDSLFVKFVFLWKASSDVYDYTLDTNPEGFADALAKSKWKGSTYGSIEFYAQSGTVTGTVSVNDGSDHELYLYGEKIRYLGKKTSISGCRFTTVLGNIPLKGLNFHLSDVSVPYIFNNIQLGYIVDADGAMKYLKELDLSMEPITAENEQRSFKANFSAGEQFEATGNMSEPFHLNSSQGWVGSVELSFIEIEVGNKKDVV